VVPFVLAQLKPYLISLAAGILVGMIYGVLKVKSPAPPTIALVGLLGILVGEVFVSWAVDYFRGLH
jgi:XapX domain-containing protein